MQSLPTHPPFHGPAEAVRCPECGYDLRGVVADWRDSWPLEVRCSECGTAIDTARLFGPHAPRWFFEHAPGGLLWSWLRTSLWALRPRFWRKIRSAGPVRYQRLILFALVWMMTLPLFTHLIAATIAMQVLRPVLLPQHRGEWWYLVFWPYGDNPRESLQFFASFLVDSFLMVLPLLLMPLFAWVSLRVRAFRTPGILRADAAASLARAACYVLPIAAVILALQIVLTAVAFGTSYLLPLVASILILVSFAIWVVLWWREFARHHLAWQYPTGAAVLLLSAAVGVGIMVGMARQMLAVQV